MTTPQWPAYDRARLVDVLIYHQRLDIGHCGCGWGVDSGHVGQSHAEHVADVYEDRRCGSCGGTGEDLTHANECDPTCDGSHERDGRATCPRGPERCPVCDGTGAALRHARQRGGPVTDNVCPTCGNWFGNHDPYCPVATTIHAIWTATFSPDKAGTPPAWNQAIETILAANAARVAAALNDGPDLTAPPADQPQGQWTTRYSEAIGLTLVEHPDGTSLRPVSGRPGEETSDVAARRVAAALNGTSAQMSTVRSGWHDHYYQDATGAWVARALVASTGTETDDAQ